VISSISQQDGILEAGLLPGCGEHHLADSSGQLVQLSWVDNGRKDSGIHSFTPFSTCANRFDMLDHLSCHGCVPRTRERTGRKKKTTKMLAKRGCHQRVYLKHSTAATMVLRREPQPFHLASRKLR